MLNLRLVFRMFVLMFLAALYVACDPETTPVAFNTGVRAWIDQPASGDSLPVGSYKLKAHARDSSGGGVERIVFLVNTIPLGTVNTNPTLPLVSAEFDWNASVPGEYRIQAQAFGRNGSALSTLVTVCVGPNCPSASAPITPTVTPTPVQSAVCKGMPVITSFVASPASIPAGGSTTISWSVANADKVEMAGVGDVPAVGTSTVSPATTTTYTLAALCGGKENMVVQSVTVTVTGGKACSGKPVISAFSASPASITVGGSSTLQWSVTNADRVEMAGVGEVGATGSRVVSPRTTTTYTLVAFCGGKENTAERSVSVTVAAAVISPTPTRTPTRPVVQPPPGCTGAPIVSSFSASPSTISPGGSSTLSWGAVSNADSVSIDQGIGGVGTPGSTTVSPSGTTIYTLTARCGSNTVTRQVQVTVQAAPPPPPDKQGPAISGVAYSDKTIYYNNSGCGATALTVSANVTDPAGVKSVQLTYRYVPSKGSPSNPIGLQMNPTGGNNYSATINALKEAYAPLGGGAGQIEFWIVAVDGAGNSAQTSPTYVSIQNCPG
jgi:hypothetical protein